MLQPINLISFFPRNMAVELPDLWGDTVTHEILKNMGIKNPYFFDGFIVFIYGPTSGMMITIDLFPTCHLWASPGPETCHELSE